MMSKKTYTDIEKNDFDGKCQKCGAIAFFLLTKNNQYVCPNCYFEDPWEALK